MKKNINESINYAISDLKNKKEIKQSFYYFNSILDNLIKYCNINNLEIPEDKIIFCIRLLGQANVTENTLFLLQGLIYKDDFLLKTIFANPYNEIILLLNQINYCIKNLNYIFSPKEKNKIKTMLKK